METLLPPNMTLLTDISPFCMNPSIPTSIVAEPFEPFQKTPPMAPLITAVRSEIEGNKVFIRITAFIDSDFTISNPNGPVLAVVNDIDVLSQFYVIYTTKEKEIKSYTAWYFELFIELSTNVTEIVASTYNLDPKTSRGTTTIVSSALGYV